MSLIRDYALSKGIGGHHRSRGRTDEWLTPPKIIRALGKFDLDPCAAVEMPWSTAANQFTARDDGLSQKWFGRVWLNPPYGPEITQWMSRMAEHGNGIALIFARTETRAFQKYVFNAADGILFLAGRIQFFKPDGTPGKWTGGAPSCLIAYGGANAFALSKCGIDGRYLEISG